MKVFQTNKNKPYHIYDDETTKWYKEHYPNWEEKLYSVGRGCTIYTNNPNPNQLKEWEGERLCLTCVRDAYKGKLIDVKEIELETEDEGSS